MAVAHGVSVLATPVEPVRRSWIGLLFAANLGLWMAYFTPIQVLLPEQVAEITPDSKELWLGIVTGIGAIVAIVVNPLAGALSDRTRIKLFGRPYGRRHVWTLAGCILSVLSIAVLAEARNLLTVIVAWCFVTVGINIMLASLTAAVPDRVPVAQRGLVSGWIGMPQALGLVIGAVLVTAVFTDIGPGYIALGLGLVVLGVPFALLTKDDPLPPGHQVRSHWKIDLRGHPDYMWAWGTRFLVQLGNALGTLYLLYFLDDAVGLDDPDTGLLYMILLYTVGMISTAMIGGWLSDRLGRRKIFVIWSGVLIAIAATLLAIWPTWSISLVAAFLFGMGFGVYLAVDTALITQVLPNEADRAKDLGVINIASAAPQALGPLLAAPIVTSLGGYPTLFALTALVSLVGAVAVVKIRSVP
ncbi:MFS transporter [Paractinoplanes lichenicola]|uniref:MFS transporter n=1 Tax=Paractinoplanes lichenicola TaxID=2802976 RepID=A0ABS1VNK8_9ACTN|nr:MFS transporter [Actinoplanes lichenicola]MBL7256315.1 MFS transporter [Actinoplanes lichenicola]